VIVSRPKGLPTTGELDARTTTYWKRRDTKGEPPTAALPVRGPSRRPARPHPSPARQGSGWQQRGRLTPLAM